MCRAPSAKEPSTCTTGEVGARRRLSRTVWTELLRKDVGVALGDAFLAGAWDEESLRARALEVLSLPPRAAWLAPLVRRTLAAYRDRPGDRRRELHAWLDTE